jgi:prolipoprotein diacylglyceryltransferase
MNWYALILGLGASLGILQVARSAPPKLVQRYLDAAILVLFAAAAGARLVYVGLHWPYYLEQPLVIIQVWQGGLSAPGAIAGGLLATFCLAKSLRVPFYRLADTLTPLLAPLCTAAWLGCWASGSAYGLPVAAGSWWGIPAIDETGTVMLRFPLQFLAALSLAVLLGWIELKKNPLKMPGQKASLMVLGVNASYLAATFLMGDPAPGWAGLRPESWMAIFLSLLNLAACLFVFRFIHLPKRGLSCEPKSSTPV